MTRPKLTIDGEKERAVSPVIGVILMVAITVILAAVIGTFVLDLGQNVQNTGPSASFGFEDADDQFDGTNDMLVIEHQSGESVDADEMRIVVRNSSTNEIAAEWDGSDGAQNGATWEINSNTFTITNTTSVGDVIVVKSPTGYDHTGNHDITITSLSTDNRIASGTVEVN